MVSMLMPLQGFNKRGKKDHEAFGTDPVVCVPDQEVRVLDDRSICTQLRFAMRLLNLCGMVEQPPGVATMVAIRCDKSIKQRSDLATALLYETEVRHVAALPTWLDTSMTFRRFPPLEKCGKRSVCGGDRLLIPACLMQHLLLSLERIPCPSPAQS
jgi:hypothetical protein